MTPNQQKAVGGSIAAVLALTAALVAPYEGFYPKTYKDMVGVPTVCFGETEKEAVALGRVRPYTRKECEDMLAGSLKKYYEGMMACVKKPMTINMQVAFTSATYNFGIGGFCKSSMARLVNAGKPKEACDALVMWNKAGGRVVRGLTIRRAGERARCLEGL